jgi:Raf kinase inhibitor-like YbhB/YbcL family protein
MNLMAYSKLTVTSQAIRHNGDIPPRYTCDGENISPPLLIKNIPFETKSLVLIVEDPDAGETFDHWLVWNIPPTESVAENSVPGILGKNSFGRNEYGGPCPPTGTHHYVFKVYALNSKLNLQAGANKKQLLQSMQQHIISTGELIGLYKKLEKGEPMD